MDAEREDGEPNLGVYVMGKALTDAICGRSLSASGNARQRRIARRREQRMAASMKRRHDAHEKLRDNLRRLHAEAIRPVIEKMYDEMMVNAHGLPASMRPRCDLL